MKRSASIAIRVVAVYARLFVSIYVQIQPSTLKFVLFARVANNFGWNRGSDFGERSLGNVSGGWLPRLTILPYHPLLVSLADIEGHLQASLTARSRRVPPCDRHQRTALSFSLAASEALAVLADRT